MTMLCIFDLMLIEAADAGGLAYGHLVPAESMFLLRGRPVDEDTRIRIGALMRNGYLAGGMPGKDGPVEATDRGRQALR
ncbi:hypothetical protein AMIS_20290 [Actinoplanes missouriensis 431]|uniref:Uncharacterized protein n=1 Tax=Actinoplanes missouriensis (strain ATCC 14538 / DSM 43046 / CBS 188.64 / JCM 3121 / NBRC 102363 / NCIMB 12654 / NRRL B-3342 / UNCC 431) TaxID=512565 RepID=I0H2L2_ACTM4|nr:hypothetical protein [Actinoplanes missouriensis]BAL87249.1 hypothetical protein AMIS_20290 [Actinoplanes missouriensis 431]